MVHVQYNDNVIGPGSPRYDNAYFVINFVRVYTVGGLPSSVSSLLDHSSTATGPTATRSNSGPNTGIVLDISSPLQLFLLCFVGALIVFV